MLISKKSVSITIKREKVRRNGTSFRIMIEKRSFLFEKLPRK